MRQRLVFVVGLILGLFGGSVCAQEVEAAHELTSRSDPLRVLFVGNSYTYYNEMPAMFAAMAKAAGTPVEVEFVGKGGATLENAVDGGYVEKRLAASAWDWVVLQEQSSLGNNRSHDGRSIISSASAYKRSALQLIELAWEYGAKPALYLTWARAAFPDEQGILNGAVLDVAQETGASIVPAGVAWMQALKEDPDIALYSPDGGHPSVVGSYLVASSLVATLLDRSPRGLPGRLEAIASARGATSGQSLSTKLLADIDPDDVATIHAAVEAAPEVLLDPTSVREMPAPIVLGPPPSQPVAIDQVEGTWEAKVLLLPGAGPSRLELEVSATDAGDLAITLELKHPEGIRPRGFFPDQEAQVSARLIDGRIEFSHPAEGFGTEFGYALGWDGSRFVGWMRHDAGEKILFSATVETRRLHP